MAQLVKGFLCQHEDLNSVPQHPCKKQKAQQHTPVTTHRGHREPGGWRQVDPQSLQHSQSSQIVRSRLGKVNPYQKLRWKGIGGHSLASTCTYRHIYIIFTLFFPQVRSGFFNNQRENNKLTTTQHKKEYTVVQKPFLTAWQLLCGYPLKVSTTQTMLPSLSLACYLNQLTLYTAQTEVYCIHSVMLRTEPRASCMLYKYSPNELHISQTLSLCAVFVCVHLFGHVVCTYLYMPQHAHRSQRTIWKTQFSPSTRWVPGIKPGCSDLAIHAFTH